MRKLRQYLSSPPGAWGIFLAICIGPSAIFIYNVYKILKAKTPSPSLFADFGSWHTMVFWTAILLALVAAMLSGLSIRHLKKTLTKWVLYTIRPLTVGAAVGLLCVSYYLLLVKHMGWELPGLKSPTI